MILRRLQPKTERSQDPADAYGAYKKLSRSIFYLLYSRCHKTGLYTIQIVHFIKSLFLMLWSIVLRGAFKAVAEFVYGIGLLGRTAFGRGEYSFVKLFTGALHGIAGGFSASRQQYAGAGFSERVSGFFRLSFADFKKYRRAHRHFFNWAPPVFGVLVLSVVLIFWNTKSFALKVMYDGRTVGYVHTQQAYFTAANAVASTVLESSGQVFELGGKPKFQLVVTSPSRITPQNRLADNIIACAGDRIVRANGLYVSGLFIGAYNDGAAMKQMLDQIINSYKTHKKGVKTEEISFLQNVTVKNGLFPRRTLTTLDAMKQQLVKGQAGEAKYVAQQGDSVETISNKLNVPLARLYTLNPSVGADGVSAGQPLTVKTKKPLLTIQVTRTEKYTRKVAFSTKKVKSKKLYVHTTKVKNGGKAGKATVTAKVTYINGKMQTKKVVATQVVKQPVAKIILVGQKPTPSTASTGNFLWPVNMGVAYMSSPFGGRRGHKGLDLACGQGTPIHAADGGVVEFAGWDSGYGNLVKIRHSGSLETMYAHCSKILVSSGTHVFKGEEIALVGHTGFVIGRTGNHCHFEVHLNGAPVNPLHFLH